MNLQGRSPLKYYFQEDDYNKAGKVSNRKQWLLVYAGSLPVHSEHLGDGVKIFVGERRLLYDNGEDI